MSSSSQLFSQGAPDSAGSIGVAAVEANHLACPKAGRWIASFDLRADLFPQLGIPGQQAHGNHAVGLTSPHCLGELKNGGACPRTTQMAERPLHQREHSVGEMVLLEEGGPIHFALEEGVEAKDRGPAICREDGGSGGAEVLEGHERNRPLFVGVGVIYALAA